MPEPTEPAAGVAERAAFLQRLYRTISEMNQVIVREKDRDRLFAEVCRIGVEHGRFAMVWAGLVDVPGGDVRPLAAAGLEAGYADELVIHLDAPSPELRPAARAVLEDRVVVVDDTEIDPGFAPWREAARQRGFRSCAAFPVRADDSVRGVLKVYAGEPGAFHAEVVTLLVELAADLGYALHALESEEQRRQAEEALRRSEGSLREAQRIAHIGHWDLDLTRNLLTWSDEIFRIFEIDPDRFGASYQAFLQAVHPDDRLFVDAAYSESVRQRKPYDIVHRLLLADGRVKYVNERCETFYGDGGQPLRSLGTVQDVTERKHLEEEMRRSAAVTEQAAEAIVITDPGAVIQYVNPAFTRITGYSREDAVGKNPRFLQSGRHDRDFYREMWATLLRGETWHGHLVNRRKDGALFEEDATISPVRDERGGVVHYVGVKRDVTLEVALEAQLRQSQKMEAIGRLAGGVAHDFNNLLQAMLAHTQLLRMDPGRAESELDELEAQIRRGTALTGQLLSLSRRQEARRERLDLNDVVSSVGRLLRRLVRENVALVIELDGAAVMVEADRGQLEQVLMNLTINAADAMPGGGRVSIRTGRQDALAFFSVEDTGTGIPEEIRSEVFEPLFTTKAAGHGTGLGLSVVHDIVLRHGGRIDLESTEGVGTTVRVLLPRLASGEALPASLPAAGTASSAGQGERILVVEDEPAARVGLRAVLRSLGYQVTLVGSGGEAVALPAAPAFDALLADMMLPDLDGSALARELLARWPGLRVILMSGYSEGDVLDRAADLGEIQFLQKPFDMSTLASALRQALAGTPSP